MVSRQISNLSTEDLHYLETLLGVEFARLNEYSKQFESKNGYSPGSDSKKILRLLNAVRSQKSLSKMPKW